MCRTGQHTGPSPNDTFVVREASSERHVHWGHVNRPLNEASFEALQRDNGLIDMTVDIHATGRFLR